VVWRLTPNFVRFPQRASRRVAPRLQKSLEEIR
jgi:hypothetical protein